MVEDTTVLSILRHGVWSALTGGWYYDVNRSDFGNIFHLYLWLLFLLFPFVVYLTVSNVGLAIAVYTVPIGLIFLALKLINYRLHHLFDKHAPVVDDNTAETAAGAEGAAAAAAGDSSSSDEAGDISSNQNRQRLEGDDEAIELQEIRLDERQQASTTDQSAACPAPLAEGATSGSNFHRIATDPILECSEIEERSGNTNRRLLIHQQQQQRLQRPHQRRGIDRSLSARKATPAGSLVSNQQHQQAASSADGASNSCGLSRKLSLPNRIHSHQQQQLHQQQQQQQQTQPQQQSSAATTSTATNRRQAYTQCLESLAREVNQLPLHRIAAMDRFEPSPKDLELLELYPTSRNFSQPFQRSRNGSQRRRDSLRRYSTSQQQQQQQQRQQPAQSSNPDSAAPPPPPPPSSSRRVAGVGRSQSLRAAAVAAAAERRAAAAAAAAAATSTSATTSTVSSTSNNPASSAATAVVHCRRSYSLRDRLPTGAVTVDTLRLPLPSSPAPAQPSTSSLLAAERSEKSSTSTVSLHSWIFHSADNPESSVGGQSRASIRLKQQQPSTAEERAQLLPTDGVSVDPEDSDALTDALPTEERKDRLKSNSEDETTPSNDECELHEKHRPVVDENVRTQRRASSSGATVSASAAPSVRHRLAATRRRRHPASFNQRSSARDHSVPSTSSASTAAGPSIAAAASTIETDAALAASMAASSAAPSWSVHVAESFDDTSVGAVHYYHDEAGNLMSYTFGGDQSIVHRHHPLRHPDPDAAQSSSSTTSGATGTNAPAHAGASSQLSLDPIEELDFRNFSGSVIPEVAEGNVVDFFALSSQPTIEAANAMGGRHGQSYRNNSRSERKTKVDYRFRLLPCVKSTIHVRFNRLQLRSLLDPFVTLDSVLSIVAALFVCVIGTYVLHLGLYKDIWALIYCFTMATAHFSLVHAVEPDPSSPTHGLNRVMAFSRAFYFCLCSAMLIGLRAVAIAASSDVGNEGPSVYSMRPTSGAFWLSAYRIWSGFVSALPLAFLFGLLPQPDTFLTYACEQIETHLFGGNSVTGLVSGVYVIVRGLLVWLCLGLLAAMAFASRSEAAMSVFAGALLAFAYHLGRAPADPTHLFSVISRCWACCTSCCFASRRSNESAAVDNEAAENAAPPAVSAEAQAQAEGCSHRRLSTMSNSATARNSTIDSELGLPVAAKGRDDSDEDTADPLPGEMLASMQARLANNAIMCCMVAILAFAAHVSTVFKALQPALHPVLLLVEGVIGLCLHYFLPRLRQEYPWMLFRRPLLRSQQSMNALGDSLSGQQQQQPVGKPARYELAAVYLSVFERGVLLPAICLSACTMSAQPLTLKFGQLVAAILLSLCALKMTRSVFSASPRQYLVHAFTYLLFNYDYAGCSETYLIDYLLVSFLFAKGVEFSQRVNFVYVYLAPWQVSWGDPFHVLAQAFWIPHSVFMLIQIVISTLFSTPLQPFFGSAIFLTSYVRPVKFWEKNYNTKRADASTTGMIAQVERLSASDANNLNCLYYEHLARSLQRSLAGDIAFGRWGHVLPGDFYILTSPVDDLNALVHIVEVGNGVVTFQLRGLEFKGTYCQQREVEAIRVAFEEESEKCPCCTMKHLPGLLPLRQAFIGRWYTWYRMGEPYVLESYSRSQNSLSIVLNMGGYDLRRHMIRLYIKCVIFYAARSSRLRRWLSSGAVQPTLARVGSPNFVDLDIIFSANVDCDFDSELGGVSLRRFLLNYEDWINYCGAKRSEDPIQPSSESADQLRHFCLALSLLARRAQSNNSNLAESLFTFHALFKGDFRIDTPADEWVLSDISILKRVLSPAVHMTLRLLQDYHLGEMYDDNASLYNSIESYETDWVICHETDPNWRVAVLQNRPLLMALRHTAEDGQMDFHVVQMRLAQLRFSLIKLNPESVRGLWAGQQIELIFFRNQNSERGSIQNQTSVLRNMINSSCDDPVGYPAYVSPLLTSFSTRSPLYTRYLGSEWSIKRFFNSVRQCLLACALHCHSVANNPSSCPPPQQQQQQASLPSCQDLQQQQQQQQRASSLRSNVSLPQQPQQSSYCSYRVRVVSPSQNLLLPDSARLKGLVWPANLIGPEQLLATQSAQLEHLTQRLEEARVLHAWTPGGSADAKQRSPINQPVLLVELRAANPGGPLVCALVLAQHAIRIEEPQQQQQQQQPSVSTTTSSSAELSSSTVPPPPTPLLPPRVLILSSTNRNETTNISGSNNNNGNGDEYDDNVAIV